MLKKILILFMTILVLIGCSTQKEEKPEVRVPKALEKFDSLQHLTFEEVDELLTDKKSGILYFGWIVRCGDSLNFQENYLEEKLNNNPELKNNIFVVNLETENPDGLMNKDLRLPMQEKYGVGYSPTILLVKEGVVTLKSEWQVKTSDPITAIPKTELDAFFTEAGYNQ